MTKLPPEIWNQVFIFLHQRDKVECMTVCRDWAAIIEPTCLFHTVRIGSPQQLVSALMKFKDERENAAKVERLVLDFDLDKIDSNMLSAIFPNVKEYYDMIAINSCVLLGLGVCPKLTALRLESNGPIDGDEFVKLLRNTPALKSLKVTFCNFTVDDLESLHRNAPCLESLTLQKALVFCNTPQQNIRPATAMTKLYLQGARTGSVESAQNLFHYIGLKYPNIKELSHTVYATELEEFEEEAYYDNGLMPLFKKLGPQLNTFKLGIQGDTQFSFTKLDDVGCQIKRFELSNDHPSDGALLMDPLRGLADSGQTEYIQFFRLVRIVPFESYELLGRFTMLRRLDIRYADDDDDDDDEEERMLNLNDFIGSIGDGLVDLRLNNVPLDFDLLTIRKYHALQHLSITGVTLPSRLDSFVSQSFPNLKVLKFRRVDLSDHGFIIPNIDLTCFEMINDFPEEEDTVLVVTCKNNEQRWYTAKSTLDTLHTASGISSDMDPNLYPLVIS